MAWWIIGVLGILVGSWMSIERWFCIAFDTFAGGWMPNFRYIRIVTFDIFGTLNKQRKLLIKIFTHFRSCYFNKTLMVLYMIADRTHNHQFWESKKRKWKRYRNQQKIISILIHLRLALESSTQKFSHTNTNHP